MLHLNECVERDRELCVLSNDRSNARRTPKAFISAWWRRTLSEARQRTDALHIVNTHWLQMSSSKNSWFSLSQSSNESLGSAGDSCLERSCLFSRIVNPRLSRKLASEGKTVWWPLYHEWLPRTHKEEPRLFFGSTTPNATLIKARPKLHSCAYFWPHPWWKKSTLPEQSTAEVPHLCLCITPYCRCYCARS